MRCCEDDDLVLGGAYELSDDVELKVVPIDLVSSENVGVTAEEDSPGVCGGCSSSSFSSWPCLMNCRASCAVVRGVQLLLV